MTPGVGCFYRLGPLFVLCWSSYVMPAAKKIKLFVSEVLGPKNNLLRRFRPAERGSGSSGGGEERASGG